MSIQKPEIDYSTRDYEGFREDLINQLKVKIPEYSDFSESDVGIVIIELLSYGLDILSYYNDKVANEIFLETSEEKESLIKICKLLNYNIKGSTSAKVYQVVEITPRPQSFVISKGVKFSTDIPSLYEQIIFEVEEDTIIPPNMTGLEKDENGEYLYQIPLVQGYTVSNDIIGTSNGTPYQSFKLNFKPVLQDSVQVFVNEGSYYKLWDKVNNFIDSDSSNQVYRMYENGDNETVIEFGSGSSGAIPLSYKNGIIATYRVSGGSSGNITAHSITKMKTNLAGVIQTFNPKVPYILGEDNESITDIKTNAPASLRTLGDKAVTINDYKDLALLRGDILLAEASESSDNRFTVDLRLLLKNGSTLTNDIIADIQDYFKYKKEIGIIINIIPILLKPLNLVITTRINYRYRNSDIQTAINDILDTYFYIGSFDIGQEFVVHSLISKIIQLEGVIDCDVVVSNGNVVSNNEVATLGTASIIVTGGV